MFGGFRSPGTWRGSVCGIDVVGAKNGEHGLKGEKGAKMTIGKKGIGKRVRN